MQQMFSQESNLVEVEVIAKQLLFCFLEGNFLNYRIWCHI